MNDEVSRSVAKSAEFFRLADKAGTNDREDITAGDGYSRYDHPRELDEFEDAVQYQGEEDAIIRFGTDVWLVVDGKALDLTDLGDVDLQNDCDTCGGSAIAGVFAPVNSVYGIERCDNCEIFPGDFEAAAAVAATIPGATIWYLPSVP